MFGLRIENGFKDFYCSSKAAFSTQCKEVIHHSSLSAHLLRIVYVTTKSETKEEAKEEMKKRSIKKNLNNLNRQFVDKTNEYFQNGRSTNNDIIWKFNLA